MDRRTFLVGMAGAAAVARTGWAFEAQDAPIPIIDTHIHLFRERAAPAPPAGPAGPASAPAATAPAPGGRGQAGGRGGGARPAALPPRYRGVAAPEGVVGAIEIEASAQVDETQWVLDTIETDPIMVGTVGNLDTDKPEFAAQLERFMRSRLLLGVRYGNLWNRDIAAQVANPVFIDNLKRLADAGLVLDSANPNLPLLDALIRINDRVPNLRIIADHLPNFTPPQNDPDKANYATILREFTQRPNIFVKVSEVVRRVDGQVPLDLNFHRERLDQIFGAFGEDRVIFGSDWPLSEGLAPLGSVIGLVREFFATKPRAVSEKYFYRNSIKVYRWIPRTPEQRALLG